MIIQQNKNAVRKHRHDRSRHSLAGTAEKPRLNIYRSTNHIYAQIIDDGAGKTLVSGSTMDKEFKAKGKTKKEEAFLVGQMLGERAKKKGITKVVFDRGGYLYTGSVQQIAEGARKAGLEF